MARVCKPNIEFELTIPKNLKELAKTIEDNMVLLQKFVDNVNQQVNEFNLGFFERFLNFWTARQERVNSENVFFDSLNIKEKISESYS